MKKLFVVSDVHGHCTLLRLALDRAGYDPNREDHILVSCGDYFDRGNENVEVLKFFERQRHGVLLRGNHEDMLLKLLYTGKMLPHHFLNGTSRTMENFFGRYWLDPANGFVNLSGKTRTVDRLCEFINGTGITTKTEHYVFVHGWFPERALTAQDRAAASREDWEKARWLRWTDHYHGERPLPDKTLVCGHVPTFCSGRQEGIPNENGDTIFYGNGLIAIDAGTFDSKHINVLVLEEPVKPEKGSGFDTKNSHICNWTTKSQWGGSR